MASSQQKFREATVETWNQCIEDGLEYRRKYGREANWAKCESLFYQANKIQANNVGPNILSATGDSLLSTLLVPNPFFILKSLRMDCLDATPVLESILNTLIYSLGIKDTVAQSALHAYLYGVGIMKIGYDSEFGYEPDLDLGQHANTVLGMSLTQFDKKGQKIEYDTRIEPGMPWVKPVLPHDFIVPWGCVKLKDSPWCAHRIIRHIDDIKADPKYENKRDLVPQLSMSDYMNSYLSVMKPYRMGVTSNISRRGSFSDAAEYVEMWEIHDARTGRVFVVAQGYDKFLRNEIDYLQEDGLPFVSLSFIPTARSFWTTPDTVYLQAPQEEAIDIAHIQRKQRRISLLKFMYEEGALDNDELEKFFSSEIGIGIKYKAGLTSNGQAPVTAMTPSNNNNQLQVEAEAMRRDARETVGFSRNQQGEYEAAGRRTATEASIVQQNSDQRLNRRTDALSTSYCEIGQKLAKTIVKFWRTPRLTEIIGQDGAAQWTTFVGSSLRGEYQYKVGFSSEPVEGKKARMQNAMMLYANLSQDPTIDPIALRRMLARAFNDPEFTSLFKPGVISNAGLLPAVQGMQQQLGQTMLGSGAGQPGPGTLPEVSSGGDRTKSVLQHTSGGPSVGP